MNHQQHSNRDVKIDLIKCFALIGVVATHSIATVVNPMINFWVIPMFFMSSGLFFRDKPLRQIFTSSFRSLMIPYFAVCGFICIVLLIQSYLYNDFTKFTDFIRGTLCATPNPLIGSNNIVGNGTVFALWFLPAMFICRITYSILFKITSYVCFQAESNNSTNHSRNILFYILMFTETFTLLYISSVLVARYGHIPMCFAQGIGGATFFYFIGYVIKSYRILHKQVNPLFHILTIVTCIWCYYSGKMQLATCEYPNMPINIIAPICMFISTYQIIGFVFNHKIFQFFGTISLLVLCTHSIDGILGISFNITYPIAESLSIPKSLILFPMQMLVAFLGSYYLSKFRLVRVLMQFKNHIKTLDAQTNTAAS